MGVPSLIRPKNQLPSAVSPYNDRANQLVIFNDQPLVDTARRVAENDVFAALTFGKIARREQITARDLQLCR